MDRHLQRDLENLKNQEENFKQLTERAQQLATQVLSAALLSQKNGHMPFSCTCILPAAFVVTATVKLHVTNIKQVSGVAHAKIIISGSMRMQQCHLTPIMNHVCCVISLLLHLP